MAEFLKALNISIKLNINATLAIYRSHSRFINNNPRASPMLKIRLKMSNRVNNVKLELLYLYRNEENESEAHEEVSKPYSLYQFF
jgi:phosphoenolpyruvate carboxylase